MKPHVWVVDDSLTVRMDLRAVLCAAGFWVKTCSSIVSARHELTVNVFDLIILDHVLPDGSGVDLFGKFLQGRSCHNAKFRRSLLSDLAIRVVKGGELRSQVGPDQ